jgi:hypothetical protein
LVSRTWGTPWMEEASALGMSARGRWRAGRFVCRVFSAWCHRSIKNRLAGLSCRARTRAECHHGAQIARSGHADRPSPQQTFRPTRPCNGRSSP